MYIHTCPWTLELPVKVNGVTIAWLPDLDVTLCIKPDGTLFKVLVSFADGSGQLQVMDGVAFDIAAEQLDLHRDEIMDRSTITGEPIDADQMLERFKRRIDELTA